MSRRRHLQTCHALRIRASSPQAGASMRSHMAKSGPGNAVGAATKPLAAAGANAPFGTDLNTAPEVGGLKEGFGGHVPRNSPRSNSSSNMRSPSPRAAGGRPRSPSPSAARDRRAEGKGGGSPPRWSFAPEGYAGHKPQKASPACDLRGQNRETAGRAPFGTGQECGAAAIAWHDAMPQRARQRTRPEQPSYRSSPGRPPRPELSANGSHPSQADRHRSPRSSSVRSPRPVVSANGNPLRRADGCGGLATSRSEGSFSEASSKRTSGSASSASMGSASSTASTEPGARPSIPGYSGFIPRKAAENFHGATFASTNRRIAWDG